MTYITEENPLYKEEKHLSFLSPWNLRKTNKKKREKETLKRERERKEKKMTRRFHFFFIVSIISLLANSIHSQILNRHNFPEGFIFGTAASAFQVILCFCLVNYKIATFNKKKNYKIALIRFCKAQTVSVVPLWVSLLES